jgi:hypothetical protein
METPDQPELCLPKEKFIKGFINKFLQALANTKSDASSGR